MSRYPRNVLADRARPLPALRFDINEVAGILRMSRAQLYKRIAEGGIKIQKDGARTYVTLKEIERYVEACGEGSTPPSTLTPAAVKDAADLCGCIHDDGHPDRESFPAQEPYWSAAEDAREYAQDVAAVFDEQARQCRGRGRFRGNPVYHVAINWMEGEHPTLQQAERASRHVMRALGFGECQAVYSIHRDTGNDHVHLVINRVHPSKLTAISVPRGDYFLLDRCMRELELELGCARAQGPYVTVDTAGGPRIVRMSRTERAARGLLQNPEGPRISSRAQRAEHNMTAQSFQRWLTGAPSAAVHRSIAMPGATWQDIHDTLAVWSCTMQPKGSGMVVTTTLSSGRVLAAKGARGMMRSGWRAAPKGRRRAENLPSDSHGSRSSFEHSAGGSGSHCECGKSESDAHSPAHSVNSVTGCAAYPRHAGTEVLRSPSGPSRRPASAKCYKAARLPSDAP